MKKTLLFFIVLLLTGCNTYLDNDNQILESTSGSNIDFFSNPSDADTNQSLYELIDKDIQNPGYLISEMPIEIDENNDLNILAEDQKSVYVEKILSPDEIIISFLATVDAKYIIKLEKIKLAGINDNITDCEEKIIFNKMKEIIEKQYVYLDSDSKNENLKYILIWKKDLKEENVLSFFTKKAPQDQIQLNLSLVRIGYSKPASYNYDLIDEFQESESVAKAFNNGIWRQCEGSNNQNKETELNSKKNDDLTAYLLNFQEAYCGLKKLQYEFWSDYYSDEFTKTRTKDGTDIPTMRIIGKISLDRTKIYDIDGWVASLDKYETKENFNESNRLLILAYGFLKDYFSGSSNLKDFNDFKTNVTPKLISYNETIEQISIVLSREYEDLVIQDNTLDTTISRSASNIKLLCDLTMGIHAENDKSVKNASEELKEAYISLNNTDKLTRSSNNAYYVYGKTSNNCEKIVVNASNTTTGNYDSYQLTKYKKGDTSFKYGIREDWNNLEVGTNTYTFTAHCEGDQVKTVNTTLSYSVSQPSYNNNTPSYYPSNTYSSSKSYYDYDDGYKWAENNDINDFDDCQYEFGTGDAEDGCNEYVKENYTGYKSFNGYECTEDCSGHEAGYNWAEENDISDVYDCDGNSNSFNEGCEAYVEDNY